MRHTISVALCTYNGERFLPRQLASIASQNRPPDEVVVCDDRSTDHTIEILREFGSSARFPVKIIENEQNLGSAKNFEKAIRLCSGTFIALSDQDDTWYPNRLQRSEEELSAHPEAGLVFSDGEIVDDQDRPIGKRLWHAFSLTEDRRKALMAGHYELLVKYRFVTGATVMFRSSLRDRCLPFPSEYIHDEWMAALLAVFCELRAIEEPLIRYRSHESQQVGSPAETAPRWKVEKHWETLAGEQGVKEYWAGISRYANFARRVVGVVSQMDLDDRGRSILASYEHWLAFALFRLQLPSARYRRLSPILRNYRRYEKHALGAKSALKDLLRRQPAPSAPTL
jgi:glycosyltransferase involved in cell wall biosynthesis